MNRCLLWLPFALATALAPHTIAQTATDPSDTLFVPDKFVPLSAFVDDNGTAGQVSLAIPTGVVSWVQSHGGTFKIAVNRGVAIEYIDLPIGIGIAPGGVIAISNNAPGVFVVVSDLLKNDFFDEGPNKSAIVTHWDASLNALPDPSHPRGGQSLTANDALALFDFIGQTSILCGVESTKLTDVNLGPINNTDPSHGDSFGQFYYSTNKYAWFSDGTEVTPQKDGDPADADVPAFERYIGENFATYGVTRLGCIWLSDRAREITGYPVMHRNQPFALNTSALYERQVIDGAPLFQIAHAHLVDYQDPAIRGSESSLASFLLPPGWTRNTTARYPVVFVGHYDIHFATFGIPGVRVLKNLGGLLNDSNFRAIGIIWNGGGDGVARARHATAPAMSFTNLFRSVAASHLSADTTSDHVRGGVDGAQRVALRSGPIVNGSLLVPLEDATIAVQR